MSIEVTCPGCYDEHGFNEEPDGTIHIDRTSHKCTMPNCECCGIGNGSRAPGWLSEFNRDEVKK